ncbi:uncharacterized protein EV420DRAFT_1281317 [Desarmillaria tabescens]|uniref:Nucleolar protein 9 n=1 Tax=Armillaria tabescens TaxID=1929756 RepID=A0AA39J6A3_ARMTA|nr:uncharacterized protein EV420DRAFT_1281317 [Desarmillaria tabescens]KAK0436046.1 hypothetical protein EV420DRAFT_1281317 [Desarmillaria tabescens]
MPHENRKRGKKHKKPAPDADTEQQQHSTEPEPKVEAGPSWIIPNPQQEQEQDLEALFGYLDVDVKAYFQTVDMQMQQWQDREVEVDDEGKCAVRKGRRKLIFCICLEKHSFFLAALTEMTGKEKQLATDPECLVVLERIVHSMDDFVRRVFLDSLTGLYETLARHQFASHVCQTLLKVSGETVSREMGILPEIPQGDAKKRHLPMITELVLDLCDIRSELLPVLPLLLHDTFGSHIICMLALLLSPISNTHTQSQTSKRSKSWKGKQGEMWSLFKSEKGEERKGERPRSFREAARKVVGAFREGMSDNEVWACAGSKVVCPGLDVLIEVEAKHGMSNESRSLMDRVLVGMVMNSLMPTTESDYIHTLLQDATLSHLLETIIIQSPQPVFDVLWCTYLCPENGSVEWLATHAVSNYVLAQAMGRVNPTQLGAMVEVGGGGEDVWGALKGAFGCEEVDEAEVLIRAVMSLKMVEVCVCPYWLYSAHVCRGIGLQVHEYTSRAKCTGSIVIAVHAASEGSIQHWDHREVSQQYSPRFLNSNFFFFSILSLPITSLIPLTQHPISSCVLNVFLDSPTVPHKAKRQLVLGFLGHFHELVDDRIGSQVGERCWGWSDMYMKEKIAWSMMDYEQSVAASFYGRFFIRALNLYVLKKRLGEWRDLVGKAKEKKEDVEPAVEVEQEAEKLKQKWKQEKEKEKDEIEMVFKKVRKKGTLEGDLKEKQEKHAGVLDDRVMEAIRSAPGEGKKKRKW